MSALFRTGTDLSTIFEARTTAKIADVGILESGVDISNTYENIASGSAAATTGYLKNGADLNTLFAAFGSVASITISPASTPITRQRSLTCYAILLIENTGIEYSNAVGGTTSMSVSRGNWLDEGSASDVWVERVLDSGTLNHADPGSGRLNLGTSRTYGVVDTTDNSTAVTATVTFNYYDAASGGNLLDSVTVNFSANRGIL